MQNLRKILTGKHIDITINTQEDPHTESAAPTSDGFMISIGGKKLQVVITGSITTWPEADKYARALGPGWRLPNEEEMLTLLKNEHDEMTSVAIESQAKGIPLSGSSGGAANASLWTSDENKLNRNMAVLGDIDSRATYVVLKRFYARAIYIKG